ncbi:MAG: AraC family transcriptional regulator ligand-binding domain-containing protein [Aquabacterium sp.]
MASGQLHIGYARLLLAHLEQVGVDVQSLYGAGRIEGIQKRDAPSRLPIDDWDAMMAEADACLGRSDMALAMSAFIKPMDIGAIGFLRMACRTLQESAEAFAEFFPLLTDAYALKVRLADGRLTTTMLPLKPYRSPRLERLTLATICWHSRWLVQRQDMRFDGHFACPSPKGAHLRTYGHAFGGELRFNANAASVTCPRGAESLLVSRSDDSVRDLLRAHLSKEMAVLDDACTNLAQQVVNEIRRQIGHEEVRIERVAEALGLSTRTLQSRMAPTGLTFRELVDRTRHAVALDHLGNPGMSLVDIADMLGFSSQASFNRAFKRWTDLAPGEYRRLKMSVTR